MAAFERCEWTSGAAALAAALPAGPVDDAVFDRFIEDIRAGMGAMCSDIIACDAPGPASADLSRLRFRNLTRR